MAEQAGEAMADADMGCNGVADDVSGGMPSPSHMPASSSQQSALPGDTTPTDGSDGVVVQSTFPKDANSVDGRDGVGQQATCGSTRDPTEATQTVMGPPIAPASMFYTFEPSRRAKDADEQVDDPYIACRLAAVVVILFRAGDIKNAKILGQFAVDLLGKETWHESLPPYLGSKPEAGDVDAVGGLLQEAQAALQLLDSHNAGYLEGVLATLR